MSDAIAVGYHEAPRRERVRYGVTTRVDRREGDAGDDRRGHAGFGLRVASLVLLMSCGTAEGSEKSEPLTVERVCARTIECSAVVDDTPMCNACVASVAAKWNEEIKAAFGDDPPDFLSYPCTSVVAWARGVQLDRCVAERWPERGRPK